MVRVSLIVLQGPGTTWPSDRVASYRKKLEAAGHDVEVVAVRDPSAIDAEEGSVIAWDSGLSCAAVTGLRASTGDRLVLLDLGTAYAPEEVLAVVEALGSGEADLVVAARPNRLVGAASRRLLGTADPFSRLVGMTREAADRADGRFSPVGSRFAMEMLARVEGRRVDVPARAVRPAAWIAPSLDDVRLVKRLADERFGNGSRLIQFCFVGASGMVVDLTLYALFQTILSRTPMAGMVAPVVGGSLTLVVSALLAVGTAVTWNFSINRRLTFNDARGGSIVAQYLRYLFSNTLGIAVNLTIRLTLPRYVRFFAAHRLAAAVVGIVAATGISFTMARWFVFSRVPAVEDESRALAAKKARVGVASPTRPNSPHPRLEHSVAQFSESLD